MFDAKIADQLTADEATIGETTFYFSKIGTVKAWPIFLEIRAEIGKALRERGIVVNLQDGNSLAAALISLALTLPTPFIQQLQAEMFKYVQYKNEHTSDGRQDLTDTEDMAFDGLEAVDIGEVLARCLAVNFTGSIRRIGGWASLLETPNSPP